MGSCCAAVTKKDANTRFSAGAELDPVERRAPRVGIPGSRDPRRNAGQQTREKSTSFRALPLGHRSSVCRVLKTMAIRCTAGIPDVLRGTHRRRRSLRMLLCVRGDKHAKGTRVGASKVCASPVDSRFAGSETRRAHRDSHASSPNSAWKSLRL